MEPAVIRFMTFNIRFAAADDGGNAWPFRQECMIRAIRSLSPDVLCVQECMSVQGDFLVEHLPGWVHAQSEADLPFDLEMNPVFYRRDRFALEEKRVIWLSETPEIAGSAGWDAGMPRTAVVLALRDEQHGGRPFRLVNTHLDHVGAEARLRGAELLAGSQRQPALPEVIMGDFNADAGDSAPWHALARAGFQDAWQAAPDTGGPTQTYHGFQDPAAETERIDWIMVRGGWQVQRCHTCTYAEEGRYPSDHYPVYADLAWA